MIAYRDSNLSCLSGRCFSPLACDGFGYCRELNLKSTTNPARVEVRLGVTRTSCCSGGTPEGRK